MIPANEHRLGNWIECHFQTTRFRGQILAIRRTGHVEVLDGDHVNAYSVDNVEGIPLEPEILERVGFKLRSTWYKANGNGLFTIKESTVADGEYMVWWNSVTCFIVPMQYLHQLQNLYFCLTGEELTINL